VLVVYRSVKSARQGDRVGICVTNLDPSLIERSVAAAPGSVPSLRCAVCLVKKVRFYKHPCKSFSKFHISIGHSTVIATVIFFGARELALQKRSHDLNHSLPSLNASYHSGFPAVQFQMSSSSASREPPARSDTKRASQKGCDGGYELQEQMVDADGLSYGTEPLQWALLQFQQSIYCPINSLVIGSRLDADTSEGAGGSAANQCRLAFFGPLKEILEDDSDLVRTGIYSWKTKHCEVFRLTDVSRTGRCSEAVAWKLVTGSGSVTPFLGLLVETEAGDLGTIVSSFGADGEACICLLIIVYTVSLSKHHLSCGRQMSSQIHCRCGIADRIEAAVPVQEVPLRQEPRSGPKRADGAAPPREPCEQG